MSSDNGLVLYILKQKIALASWGYRKRIFKITPQEFLYFAREDFSQNSKRSLVNGLSNAKRAIDCQLDSILYVIGYYEKSKKEQWHFPQKIQFLRDFGIVSPNILKRVNRTRNLLEHEYICPSKSSVENAIDVAELFLIATEKMTDRKVYDFSFDLSMNKKLAKKVNNMVYSQLLFEYNKKNHCLYIELDKKVIINKNHPRYNDLLRKYIEFMKSSL